MPHYLNLGVVLRYDFIITYLAVMFFIQWILAKVRIMRLSNVFQRVWESRNRKIHRRRSYPLQNPNRGKGR
jgi:hypothetical protein